MEEGSKIGSFWTGVALAFAFAIVGFPMITMLVFTIFSSLILIILSVIVLIGIFFIARRSSKLKYILLGVFTFIGACLIFFGTCFAGAGLETATGSSGEFAGVSGMIMALPFAIGFAIWFLIFIGKKVKKVSGEAKVAEHQEVLR